MIDSLMHDFINDWISISEFDLIVGDNIGDTTTDFLFDSLTLFAFLLNNEYLYLRRLAAQWKNCDFVS